MNEATDRRQETTASIVGAIDERFQRWELKLDQRFDKLEAKMEQRAQWEKEIELRLAALEGVNRIITWVTASISVLLLTGALTFGWALLSNRIDIVDHNSSVIVVTATPHP